MFNHSLERSSTAALLKSRPRGDSRHGLEDEMPLRQDWEPEWSESGQWWEWHLRISAASTVLDLRVGTRLSRGTRAVEGVPYPCSRTETNSGSSAFGAALLSKHGVQA